MSRKNFFLFILFYSQVVFAQLDDPVLLKINNKEVKRSEFEYFAKSPDAKGISMEEAALLNAFIDYQLKIAEAEAFRLDTNFSFRSQLHDYRIRSINQVFEKNVQKFLPSSEENRINDDNQSFLISQIFKYLPQHISSNELDNQKVLFDSLYNAICNNPGSEYFNDMVNMYSDVKEKIWVNTTQLPEIFEHHLFKIPKDGISEVFISPMGIHIVKVHNAGTLLVIENKRKDFFYSKQEKDILLENLMKEYSYHPNPEAINELNQYGITDKVLFTIDNSKFTGIHFSYFQENHPGLIPDVFDDFLCKSFFDHIYMQSITNPIVEQQLQIYRNNLLAETITRIMSNGNMEEKSLAAYFKKNKKKYDWEEKRFSGVIVMCMNKRAEKKARELLKKYPANEWESILNKEFDSGGIPLVRMESGVFSYGDNPFVDKFVFKKGNLNSQSSYPYVIVIGKKKKGPETYHEVRSAVEADYQKYVLNLWLSDLRKNSKVEINEEVLKTVNNHWKN